MNTLSRPGTWFLFDYGMVISAAPLQEDWDALREATGLDLQHASSPYWTARLEFDGGALSPAAYWSGVMGRTAGADEVARLEELDARQWSRLNPRTLEVLELLAGEGAQLALLSNMPAEISYRYESAAPWAPYFRKRYFSGRLGMVKPDSRIYKHVLADLGVAAGSIVFIDDSAANIAAAGSMGLQTIQHTERTDLQRELLALRADG